MFNLKYHDKLACKIQAFGDYLNQSALEKETLAMILSKSELASEIRTEIMIYEEILEEYYKIFEDIIHKE